MQTRKESFVESLMNILIGYTVAVGSTFLVFPFFDIHIPASSNFWIGFYFTLISLMRSYFVRRYFNSKIQSKREANR